VPNFSFILTTLIPLSVLSFFFIWTKNRFKLLEPGFTVSPVVDLAKAKLISESIAEVNHLNPYSLCRSPVYFTLRVSVEFPTSDPPLFSVIH